MKQILLLALLFISITSFYPQSFEYKVQRDYKDCHPYFNTDHKWVSVFNKHYKLTESYEKSYYSSLPNGDKIFFGEGQNSEKIKERICYIEDRVAVPISSQRVDLGQGEWTLRPIWILRKIKKGE